MRRISVGVLVVAALAASFALGRRHPYAQAATGPARHVLYYVDPMHPSYKSQSPGIAPDCGMQLEPVFEQGSGDAVAASHVMPAGAISIPVTAQTLLGMRTAEVEDTGRTRIIRAAGRVVPEDTRLYRINSGVDGFIRDTFEDSVGTFVKKDQKLAAYYAPEFLAAASGFLAANERVPGSVSKEGVRSIQNYTDRLRNLGMSDLQIRRMAENRQLPESIDVFAPADGFILARNVSPGQHFEHGMEFYRIADLSRVWVLAEVYEPDIRYLRPGGSAEISLRDKGRLLNARITDSLPQSDAGGGTIKLRLEVQNPAFLLRPEMLVDIALPVRMPPAVTVPVDALVDSGAETRVYVARGDGTFEPRQVEIGWRMDERAEILRGLKPGERVVASATFLVDSETRLRSQQSVAVARRTGDRPANAAAKTEKDPNCGMRVDPAQAAASGNTLVVRNTTLYFCSRQCKEAYQNAGKTAMHYGGGDD